MLVSAHNSLCVEPVLTFGNEEQKRKYLPKLSSGEIIGCLSLTEAGSGSDMGAARCRAVDQGDGIQDVGITTNGILLADVADAIFKDKIGGRGVRVAFANRNQWHDLFR